MKEIIIRSGKKPLLNKSALKDNLTDLGYGVIYNDKMQADMFLVRTEGKFIQRADLQQLYREAQNMTGKLPYEDILIMEANVMEKKFYRHLPKMDVLAFKDPKDHCYLFFQNGVVDIQRNGKVSLVTPEDIDTGQSKIWETNIMKHSFEYAKDWQKGEWYRFCNNVVGDEGLPYLMRAMGYLIHTYKDPANPKAIILSESHQDEGGEANGGTGKSIIATKALAVFRNVSTVDGKRWNPKDRFNFQGVSEEADIVALEDVPMRFKYEAIYNYISGDSEIERKSMTSIKVPYERSAKFIITTNFGIALHGGSDRRRRCVIGLKNFYSDKFTPMDDFGHRLFDDWGDVEWNRFFSFMVECVKMYFNKGIESYANENIEAVAGRRFIGEEMYYYCIDNHKEFTTNSGSSEALYQKIVADGASMGLRQDDCLKRFYMCMGSIGLRKIVKRTGAPSRVREITFEIEDSLKLEEAIRRANGEATDTIEYIVEKQKVKKEPIKGECPF